MHRFKLSCSVHCGDRQTDMGSGWKSETTSIIIYVIPPLTSVQVADADTIGGLQATARSSALSPLISHHLIVPYDTIMNLSFHVLIYS